MILLISDLHLEESNRETTEGFLHFLENKASSAKALYILGDFFDTWVGDDAMTFYHLSICNALRGLKEKGTNLYMIPGNRDFLMGNKFCEASGCLLLQEPSIVDYYGNTYLLMHGDSLCTRDKSYLLLRFLLRNPLSLWLFSIIPLVIRQNLAKGLRINSKSRMKKKDITDVPIEEAINVIRKYRVNTLIHGHTHRPIDHDIGTKEVPMRRMVLGAWEKYGSFIEINSTHTKLSSFRL